MKTGGHSPHRIPDGDGIALAGGHITAIGAGSGDIPAGGYINHSWRPGI